MDLKINCKSVAKRRNAIQQIIYHYDMPLVTVKDLLTETVKMNVAEYENRQENSELLRFLTKEEIEEKGTQGKIGFGRIYGERKPNVEKAIQSSLECFEDGMVVVFAGDRKLSGLDEALDLQDGSEITFVRMTMLAGRMW